MNYAFYGCSALASVDFPSSLTTIGANAFSNCTSLEIADLSLPNLESLGSNAFVGVKITKISNLGNITSLPNASSSTQNFGKKDTLEEIVLPETITYIPGSSFSGYSNLKKINTENIENIGGYVFANALDRVELRMPKLSIIEGNQAFYNSGATILDFRGSTFTETKDSFAQGSSRLTKVILPDTITYIGWEAFSGCTSLVTLICNATTPPSIQTNSLIGTPIASKTGTIYVPDASVDAYKAASGWSNYADIIKPLSEYVE